MFFVFLSIAGYVTAQVGIGTTNPNPSAALDVTSSSQGILLPRLDDTSSVGTPTAGLLIYNMQTDAPAWYDGSKWNSLSVMMPPPEIDTDSITYTVTNSAGGFLNGTYSTVRSISNSVNSSGGNPNFSELTCSKFLDINTIGAIEAIANGTSFPDMKITFKVYVPSSGTLVYSIKLTGITVLSYQTAIDTGSTNVYENLVLSGVIYGYKNWITGDSFAWNTATQTQVPY